MPCSTGTYCANSNGWYGGGENGCGTWDDPTSYYRSYYCSGGSCAYSNTDSRDYDGSDGWTGGGNSGGCGTRDDPTAYQIDYYVTANTPNQNSCTANSNDCDSSDGWYSGGNNGGCGDDPASEDRDYYASGSSCTYASCNSQDCDSSDICGNVCEGNVIRQYLDSYVVSGTNTCTSYYGAVVEDCSSKTSSDSDGDNPQAQGTVTDYTGCSGGSCSTSPVTDACTSSTQVREYLASGSSYTSYVKNCEEYEPSATYCSGNNRMRRDWGCSSGACSDAAATDTVVETCALGCNPNTGQCYNSLCSPNPCTSPPVSSCSGTSTVTYPNPGTCTQSGGTYSCSYPPTYTQCPPTGCSGTTRYYSGTCSGGSCTFGSSENCGAIASSDTDGNNAQAQGRCTDYVTCSGGSCTSTTTDDACLDSNLLREYYASGASCPTQDYDCRNYNSYYCAGSNRMQHVWGCTSSPGYCANTADVLVESCAYGCSNGQCNANPCSPNPCTSPPANSCSSNTRTYYSNPGTCTVIGSSYSCSYPPQTENCPSTGCSGETRQTGGCSGSSCYMNNVQDCNSLNGCVNSGGSYRSCSGLQACDAQNRLYNDYTCSGGACSVASSSSSSSCPIVYSNCVTCTKNDNVCIDSTLRTYAAASCSSGTCGSSYTESACPYGCKSQAGDDVCHSDACSPNPCTSPSDDVCASSSTLTTYAATGSCTNSGTGSANCAYTPSSQGCTYGCLSLGGDDRCASNTAPTLSSLSLSSTYGNYAATGQPATVTSTGSDPNNEQVRLRCGSSSGAADFCTSSYTASNPSCTFYSPWGGSADQIVYCFIEDAPGARSSVLQTTLSADNSAPAVSLSRNPSAGQILPGTSTTLTASSSDTRSGVSTTSITVDSATATTCSGTSCQHTFSPAYGRHTVSSSATDRVGNIGQSPSETFIADNPPVVAGPISYSGSCREGSTITLRCSASDTNQASNTLAVRVWAGECTGDNCFPTRSWTYFNGGTMNYQSGDTFARDVTITSADGRGIAATCQATDELGVTSNWGDSYPLCIVNQCQNPPVVTVESIVQNPSGPGTVQVTFSTDRAVQGEPTVRIKPGSQRGGTTEITATQASKQGNRYVYSFTAQSSHLSGIADISVSGNFNDRGVNCQFGRISQMTIDTDAPTTTILCDGTPCSSSTTYIGKANMVLNCNDPTTSCSQIQFGVGESPNPPLSDTYTVSRDIVPTARGLNTFTVSYRSTDAVGNVEQTKTQTVRIYAPPCANAGNCRPDCSDCGGYAQEEVKVGVVHERPTVLRGDTLNSRMYCFLRNAQTKAKTRECDINPASLKITVDKNDPNPSNRKDYFRWYYPGYDYPRYTANYDVSRVSAFLGERQDNTQNHPQTIDNIPYTFAKHWRFPIWTSEFQSEICVEGGDQTSGLIGEGCDDYTVTDSEILLDVSFPDLGVTVPRTTDGQNEANFTKTMVIDFKATPTVRTVLSTAPCTGTACDVDFSFDGQPVNKGTTWSDFERAYLPDPADAASNALSCDTYHTLNVKAVKTAEPDSGIETTVQKTFFLSCEPRLVVKPAEVRLVLSSQPGDVFEVTAINPRDEEKVFNIQALTTDPNSYPLPWIRFTCNSIGCEAGPGQGMPNDDYARLTVPAGLQRSVFVSMSTAARSGQFPVEFRGTYTEVVDGNTVTNTFSAIGTLLIFAEGLDEFAVWQLAGLMLIVIAILYYSDFLSVKKRPKRKK